MIFLLSWEFVRPALSLSRLSPLVISHLSAYNSFSLSDMKLVNFRPFNVVATSILVQLPGFALDGYVGLQWSR